MQPEIHKFSHSILDEDNYDSIQPTTHYHALPGMIWLVSNLHDGLTAIISPNKWTTAPIHPQVGVYQGDPL